MKEEILKCIFIKKKNKRQKQNSKLNVDVPKTLENGKN